MALIDKRTVQQASENGQILTWKVDNFIATYHCRWNVKDGLVRVQVMRDDPRLNVHYVKW